MRVETSAKYILEGRGACYSVACGEMRPKKLVTRQDHAGHISVAESDEYYNRGIRRGMTTLITGDRPRFSLSRSFSQDRLNPDSAKYGDCRVSLSCDSSVTWLDMADDIRTHFTPGSTDYELRFDKIPDIIARYTVSQAEDWGAAARLCVTNRSDRSIELTIQFVFGGIAIIPRSTLARYFAPDVLDAPCNHVDVQRNTARFSSDGIPWSVTAAGFPPQAPSVSSNRAWFGHTATLHPGETQAFYLVAGFTEEMERAGAALTAEQAEAWIRESDEYYSRLLADFNIATPDPILDAGFLSGIINLEYDYANPAWLEGVHYWQAPWCNNYQISAAIALGQESRARYALEFFASPDDGPCASFMSSGKPFRDSRFNFDDGLPYYLHELMQYVDQTGDTKLPEGLWPKIVASVGRVLKSRDTKGEGLLSWHLGCNAFLYQADHLSLPGEAASPSIMVAGLLDRLSVLAEKLGRNDDAARWRRRSGEMLTKAVERLWSKEDGAFYSHVDFQGIRHPARYYTDLVFPELYTALPDEYRLRSLDYLEQRLLSRGGLGQKLMRVGEFKPRCFGNDNVMPAQMAEAARALCKAGRNETGYGLLHSVALASTVFTEAPGNFPERMGDDGKGEANYIFGNPIGSFLYSVVDGLFGITLTDGGATLRWQPAFPADWDHAAITLPYVSVTYRRSEECNTISLSYTCQSTRAGILAFSVLVETSDVKAVLCNDVPVPYTLERSCGKTRIALDIALEGHAGIRIVHAPVRRSIDLSLYFNSESIRATSHWRNATTTEFNRMAFTDKGNIVTEYGSFRVPLDGPYMGMLEQGRSDPYTGSITMTSLPHAMSIPVGVKTRSLALLYVTEVECRHTGCAVGWLRLRYKDGSLEEVPLVVGKNVDSLSTHFAEDTLAIPLCAGEDSANALRITCDSGKILRTIDFEITASDVQFGLMAMLAESPAD